MNQENKLLYEDDIAIMEKQRTKVDDEYKSLVENLNSVQMANYQIVIKDFVTLAVSHLYKKMMTSTILLPQYNLVNYANAVDDLLISINQCVEREDRLALEKYHEQINKLLDKFIYLY